MSSPSIPAVSVIIPTYNRQSLLSDAIESVLAQTIRDFELVIVDDGSTDGTAGRVERQADCDRRIRYVAMEHLGCPGAARNRGVGESRAPLIAFLDSDDIWKPQKLERQVMLHRESDVMLSHTREVWLRNGRVVSQKSQTHARSGDLFADSLRKCVIGPSTCMIERSFFERAGGLRALATGDAVGERVVYR